MINSASSLVLPNLSGTVLMTWTSHNYVHYGEVVLAPIQAIQQIVRSKQVPTLVSLCFTLPFDKGVMLPCRGVPLRSRNGVLPTESVAVGKSKRRTKYRQQRHSSEENRRRLIWDAWQEESMQQQGTR